MHKENNNLKLTCDEMYNQITKNLNKIKTNNLSTIWIDVCKRLETIEGVVYKTYINHDNAESYKQEIYNASIEVYKSLNTLIFITNEQQLEENIVKIDKMIGACQRFTNLLPSFGQILYIKNMITQLDPKLKVTSNKESMEFIGKLEKLCKKIVHQNVDDKDVKMMFDAAQPFVKQHKLKKIKDDYKSSKDVMHAIIACVSDMHDDESMRLAPAMNELLTDQIKYIEQLDQIKFNVGQTKPNVDQAKPNVCTTPHNDHKKYLQVRQ